MELDVPTVERALRRFKPAVVYLYGSMAGGQMRPTSDIDLAFLPAVPCDPYEVFVAAQDLASALGRDVDLVDLSRATPVMKAQIIAHGRVLWTEDPKRRAVLEMYALSDYARTNEERAECIARFKGTSDG